MGKVKYHIKLNGLPGICDASEGNCPYGGNDQHFDTYEEAYAVSQQRYEMELSSEYMDALFDNIQNPTEENKEHLEKLESIFLNHNHERQFRPILTMAPKTLKPGDDEEAREFLDNGVIERWQYEAATHLNANEEFTIKDLKRAYSPYILMGSKLERIDPKDEISIKGSLTIPIATMREVDERAVVEVWSESFEPISNIRKAQLAFSRGIKIGKRSTPKDEEDIRRLRLKALESASKLYNLALFTPDFEDNKKYFEVWNDNRETVLYPNENLSVEDRKREQQEVIKALDDTFNKYYPVWTKYQLEHIRKLDDKVYPKTDFEHIIDSPHHPLVRYPVAFQEERARSKFYIPDIEPHTDLTYEENETGKGQYYKIKWYSDNSYKKTPIDIQEEAAKNERIYRQTVCGLRSVARRIKGVPEYGGIYIPLSDTYKGQNPGKLAPERVYLKEIVTYDTWYPREFKEDFIKGNIDISSTGVPWLSETISNYGNSK